ncbi:MAG: AraC family transcriptional regulator [bacterium]
MATMPYDYRWSTRMHVPADNEVIHILHGHLKLVTAHGAVQAGPGDTILVQAGIPHRDEFDSGEPLIVFVCYFGWSLAKPYFAQVHNSQLLKMPVAGKTELAQLFDQLRSMLIHASGADMAVQFGSLKVRAWGPVHADHHIAGARLLTILLLMLRHAKQAGVSQQPWKSAVPRRARRAQELIGKAKSYMAANYFRGIGLREVAAQVGASPCHLSHVFSRESEFSFAAHLRKIRMDKAQMLLTEESLPVGSAARAVGYQNPNYFAKVFRKCFGVSPAEFAVAKNL